MSGNSNIIFSETAKMLLNTYATHYQPVDTTTKTHIVENVDVAASTSAVNENQTCSERNAAQGIKVTGCVGGGGGVVVVVVVEINFHR